MIDFIAHDFWSAAWLVLLVAAGLVAFLTGHIPARRILLCFVMNWLGTRALVAWANDSDLAWIVLDGATVAALVLYGRSRSAMAVAILFALILALDNLAAWGGASYSQVAAGSDLLGAIGLLIMTGAHYVDGKLEHTKSRGFGRGTADRRGGGGGFVPVRRSISHGPGLSRSHLEGDQKVGA